MTIDPRRACRAWRHPLRERARLGREAVTRLRRGHAPSYTRTVDASHLVGAAAAESSVIDASARTTTGSGEISPAWIDRDVGWLEFNRRVLHEALDERTPLLERVKFVAIFASNLDEFFMKRMALIRPPHDDTG